MIRTLDLHLIGRTSSRKATTHCTVGDCAKSTREGKPWCSDHVPGHSPYVLGQLAEIDAREDEARAGPLRLQGSLAQEVLQLLAQGVPSVARLARDVAEFDHERAERYVRKLAHRGLVRLSWSRRTGRKELLQITKRGLEALGGH